MAVIPIKVLLFLAGGSAAAATTAYVSGALDPYFVEPLATVAALPEQPPTKADPKDARLPGEEPPATTPGDPAAEAPAATPPAAEKPAEAAVPPAVEKPAEAAADSAEPAPVVLAPSFDVVRVEPDGSVVIAGKAAPGAKVEVLSGSKLIGETVAGPAGDFAVVLDHQLKPGGYQIVLRSTAPDNVVAMSVETAILSVPETVDGQVLAMVEEPGKPAEVISVPETRPAAETPPAVDQTAKEQSAGPKPEESAEAAAKPEPVPAADAPVAPAATVPMIAVEAVEIEGRKIFVAGAADPGRKVRGYANDILLGDAVTSPEGRFLIETEADLPVGTYTIRVDALETDGEKVMARAAVPFEREPGEAVAAVAPSARPAPAAEQSPATAEAHASPTPAEQFPATPEAPAPKQPPPTAGAQPAQPAAEPAKPGGEAVADAPAPAVPPAGSEPPPTVAEAPPSAPAGEPGVDVAAAPAGGDKGAAPLGGDAPQVTAPKLQPVDGAVIIRRGDTLWRISRRVYGKGVRYSTIYLANQTQITDPDRIWPGQVFKVPEKSDDGAPADMSGMGDQATKAE